MTIDTPPEQAPDGPGQPTMRTWRRLALIFGVAAGVLVVLLVVALLRPWADSESTAAPASPSATPTATPSATPTASPSATPTATPSATPTAAPTATAAASDAPSGGDAPAPSDPVLAITSFAASDTTVACANDSDAIAITFTWDSTDATAAWFGVDTPNAKAGGLQQVDPSGSFTWNFYCSNAATVYTVTVEDAAGQLVHRSVTVSRQ